MEIIFCSGLTPAINRKTGKVLGYHSSRRAPNPAAVGRITGFYQLLLEK